MPGLINPHRVDESPILRVRLLGGFDLRREGEPVPPIESARAESLLAHLILHRETPQPRQHLAFLLWPDSTEAQARTNLRHLLHTLRHALPDADRFLDVTPRTLQWRPDAPYWLDVAAFVAGTEPGDDGEEVAGLRTALALYAGDLLEGCYDEWLLDERERLRNRYLAGLERLARLDEARGDHDAAILSAERLVRHDPLREESYRLLMRLHDARGDRARALRVYHVCAATVERELGVEPSAATRAVYETLVPAERETTATERGGERLGGPPLIGRAAEWSRLTGLWRATTEGRAQFVLVGGEPGIGKSRLVEEFRSWCAHHGAIAAEARSYPAEGALAYGPVAAWLRSATLAPNLGRLDRARQTELARLLPELVAAVPGLRPPEQLPEADQRQRLFDAVARAVLAAPAPVLLVADDLQWCDRESLQLMHYLLRVEPSARLLVIGTVRREEIDGRHPLNELLAGLHALDLCTEIDLERLTRAETAALAGRIARRPLAVPDAGRLHAETEGNPLFVVEAVRAGWTDGAEERARLSPKVQAAIEARLAHLSGPARELVGLAATIGREFTTDVLAGASDAGEDALVGGLDELWRRRIVREQGTDAYDFSHDKIREVAYLGLSPVRRRHWHRRVAQTLARLHAHDPGPVAGQLAAHSERAGLIDEAIAWYERAADAAQRLHANVEAIGHLARALDLLQTLPEAPERNARELAILAAFPTLLGWVDGWASERLAAVHRRALDLGRSLGVEPAAPLLRSMGVARLSRRDYAGARDCGEQLHARGVREGDDMLLVEADYVLGIAAFWQGEFVAARGHFEGAVARYRPEHRRVHLLRYGLDPKVVCQSRLGNTLWFLGYPESAIRARDAALALADEIGHPYSRAVALVFAAMLSLDMRDPDGVRAYTAMLVAEQAEREMRPNRVATEHYGGYIDVLDGRQDAGLARIRRALDESIEADHAPGMRAHSLHALTLACATAGNARAGLAAADQALATGGADRIWEAENRRLRAEFLAALGAPAAGVEAEIERALAVARRQRAPMLELRAATSLFRHRLERGAPAVSQAREQVAAIVAALPEGRDCRDVTEALALLDRG